MKSRRGLPLRTPELIDPDTWGRMEMASSQEEPRSASTAPNPIEDPEQLVIALRDQGFSGETLTHLVAETLNKAPVEVALLIAETSAAAPLRRA